MNLEQAKKDNPFAREETLKTIYEKENLEVEPMPGHVFIMPLNVQGRKEYKSNILVPENSDKITGKKDMNYKYYVHPIQGEVHYVGKRFISITGQTEEMILKPGDVVYLKREVHPESLILINGLVLAEVRQSDVLCRVKIKSSK